MMISAVQMPEVAPNTTADVGNWLTRAGMRAAVVDVDGCRDYDISSKSLRPRARLGSEINSVVLDSVFGRVDASLLMNWLQYRDIAEPVDNTCASSSSISIFTSFGMIPRSECPFGTQTFLLRRMYQEINR
jgi:hypothetical protein